MAAGDGGLFGPESVTWRIHGDPSMIIGGLRSLLVQSLNPRAMAGVDQHSDYRVDPWGRLRRTSEYVAATTFGDTATAEAAAAAVRAVHARVRGVDPHTGEDYAADDHELLAWVHNVEVHSFLVAYRRYGARLSDRDADRYVGEMVRAAELMGLSPDEVPGDLAGLRATLRAAPLEVSEAARRGMRFILAPPMPAFARPLYLVPVAAAVGLLPKEVRRLYGLPWFPPAHPAVRLTTYGLLRALNIALPGPPALREARARLAA
jgi:uncharacterized protein (DUF2236 family)